MKSNVFISFIIAVMMLSSHSLLAYDFETDGVYYKISSPTTVDVVNSGSGSCYIGKVVIPKVVSHSGLDFEVVSIASNAFSNALSMVSIDMPNGLVSIGEYAFKGCKNMTNMSIPSSVTTIESYAFDGCTGLQNLIIEDGEDLLSLGHGQTTYVYAMGDVFNGLFSDCPIESLYLGRNVEYTYIYSGNSSYFNKAPFPNQINYVTIGNEVTNIPYNTFSANNCISLSYNPPIIHDRTSNYTAPNQKSLTCSSSMIIVPSSSIEKYSSAWSRILPNYKYYPITDKIFFDSQANLDYYRSNISDTEKERCKSLAFYTETIDTSLTEFAIKMGMNPNCLYLSNSNQYQMCSNFVDYIQRQSNSIELCGKSPFESPLSFFTKVIEFCYTPSVWADGQSGWDVITLPFEPTSIEASVSGSIVPITTSTKGNFWLRQYVGSSDDAVYFASTSDGVMKANTPYLIAFPGDKMGKGSLEGQTITFKAKNVMVPATVAPEIQKNGYTFVGNYDKTADEGGGWTLNAEGNAFVWSETVGDKPFSAYFKGEAPAAGASALRMSFGQMDNATGLEQNMADLIDNADETVYTLDGRKVNAKDLKPGLYIKNHKKMMVR